MKELSRSTSQERIYADALDEAVRDRLGRASDVELRSFVYSSVLDEKLGVLDSAMHVVRQRVPSSTGDVVLEAARDEIVDKLRAAIIGTESAEPIYDPEISAERSTTAWARQFARGVAARVRLERPSLPIPESAAASVNRPYDDDERLDVVERAEQVMRGKRPPVRLHLGLGFIREAFNVPELVLPNRRTERDFLLAAVTDAGVDISNEVRSLRSTHILAPLFQRWSEEEFQAFSERGDDLIYAYLVTALSPRARPPEHVVSSVKKIVRAASSRSGWPSISVRLVRAWVAEYYAAVTDYDGRTDRQDAEARRAAEAEAWPWAVERAVSFQGNPLGVETEEDVDRKLSAFLKVAQADR